MVSIPIALACAIACSLVLGCAGAGNVADDESLGIELIKPAHPPVRGAGKVISLPPSTPSGGNDACYKDLGLPPSGGFFLDDKALESSISLRIYSEGLFNDSVRNYSVCKIWTDTLWEKLQSKNDKLRDIETERGTWWYKNNSSIYLSGGFVVGVVTTVLVVHGVTSALD